MILTKRKTTPEAYLGKTVKDAVITVPAYFNDAERWGAKSAAVVSVLNLIRIICCPPLLTSLIDHMLNHQIRLTISAKTRRRYIWCVLTHNWRRNLWSESSIRKLSLGRCEISISLFSNAKRAHNWSAFQIYIRNFSIKELILLSYRPRRTKLLIYRDLLLSSLQLFLILGLISWRT